MSDETNKLDEVQDKLSAEVEGTDEVVETVEVESIDVVEEPKEIKKDDTKKGNACDCKDIEVLNNKFVKFSCCDAVAINKLQHKLLQKGDIEGYKKTL